MILTEKLTENQALLDEILPVGKSTDLLVRNFNFGGREGRLYYLDGFLNDIVMERLVAQLINLTPKAVNQATDMQDFVDRFITYTEVDIYTKTDDVITQLLAGKSVFLIDGFKGALILDLRDYPMRSVSEPEKERVMRGSRDGFVETVIFNTALIRRRIRDPKLIVEMVNIGDRSRTDVAIVYIEDLAKPDELAIIRNKVKGIKTQSLTLNLESLAECLVRSRWYNPFPKVRYTERPDSAAAAILEGNIILLVDNAPAAMVLPTSILDFLQEPNDFYFPPLIGTYIRMIRNLIFFFTLVLSPLWLLTLESMHMLPPQLHFLGLSEPANVPVIWQLLMLEVAIDVLRLASVNTPNMLGNSLSIIGALLLGDFAVKSGWMVPDVILYMSFIAIASFTQPSIEFGYAFKFMRVLLLILTYFFKLWGFIGGLILIVIVMATNKTVTGKGYLYPLIPFDWKALKTHLYRSKIRADFDSKK
ncbi:MAG: spore germination protein [Ruminococcaceae bacterium]|nr:spore germination protein [Oscillospiraceae bacterium]